MSKRRILDIASTKKRDTMTVYNPESPSAAYVEFPATGGATDFYATLFCPTYRVANSFSEANGRNASLVYYKGFKENLLVSSNSGTQWKWRRIVFETKGTRPSSVDVSAFTSSGYMRLWVPYTSTPYATLESILFRGVKGKDWTSTFTASVDTDLCKVHHDSTRILRGGNDSAHEHKLNFWHGFNRNFQYEEEENGDTHSYGGWAANGNKNMGDVFVLDLFTDLFGLEPTGDPLQYTNR